MKKPPAKKAAAAPVVERPDIPSLPMYRYKLERARLSSGWTSLRISNATKEKLERMRLRMGGYSVSHDEALYVLASYMLGEEVPE